MRGPLHSLWNTRILGTYLRVRIAMLVAGVLAVLAAALLLGTDGLVGLVVLFVVVTVVLGALGWTLLVR
jgi:hypothetical protein